MGVVVPHTRKRASLGRPPGRPPNPPTVTYQCPTCGGQHAAHERGPDLSHLDERALRILRASALEELAAAVRGGARRAHVAEVLAVVERCDERLAVLAAGDGEV